jgi:hypothetical protein
MREDALERFDVLGIDAYAPILERMRHVEAAPPTYPCPTCERVFSSASALSAHLFDRHRHQGFYLRVNDVVPADTLVLGDEPWQIDAIAAGADPVELKLTLPNGQIHEIPLEAGRSVSILAYVEQWPTGEALRVRGIPGDRTYAIYRGSVPDLDLSLLDPLVLAAQEPLYGGAAANWAILLDAREPGNVLRQRYLEGFAELLLAVNAEVYDRDLSTASRSYTRAFGQLRVFGTRLARAATALLAFRMDAHELVMRQGAQSTLWEPAHWYSSPPREVIPTPQAGVAGRGIWIDDYLEGLINIATSALRNDPDGAHAVWARLPHSLSEGPGYGGKHDIAGARIARLVGNLELSRQMYRRLAEHPLYAREAREALL